MTRASFSTSEKQDKTFASGKSIVTNYDRSTERTQKEKSIDKTKFWQPCQRRMITSVKSHFFILGSPWQLSITWNRENNNLRLFLELQPITPVEIGWTKLILWFLTVIWKLPYHELYPFLLVGVYFDLKSHALFVAQMMFMCNFYWQFKLLNKLRVSGKLNEK